MELSNLSSEGSLLGRGENTFGEMLLSLDWLLWPWQLCLGGVSKSRAGDPATWEWGKHAPSKDWWQTHHGLHWRQWLPQSPTRGFYQVLVGLGNGHVSGFRGKSGSDLEFLVCKHLGWKKPETFGVNESAISGSLPPVRPQIIRLLKVQVSG